MTLKSFAKATAMFVAGGLALGLTFRYLGDQPVIMDAKEGFKGNTVGLFK